MLRLGGTPRTAARPVPIAGHCSLVAGVFTVVMDTPSLITFPSAVTPGTRVNLDLAGYTFFFNDDSHASSHLTNLGFGITEAQDWPVDMPFFLYLVNEDDTPGNVGCFFSRDPRIGTTPGAVAIHDQTAAAATDNQWSIFGMWPDDAGKAVKPCALIGAFRMRWSAANADWTVQALNDNDGVGKDQLTKTFGTRWQMADRQNGANVIVNNYLKCTNTPPVWATPANTRYWYTIHRDGWVDVVYSTMLAGNCTNGTNADNLQLVLPMLTSTNWYNPMVYVCAGYGAINASPSGNPDDMIMMEIAGGQAEQWILANNVALNVQANDFSDVGDDLAIQIRFKAYGSS